MNYQVPPARRRTARTVATGSLLAAALALMAVPAEAVTVVVKVGRKSHPTVSFGTQTVGSSAARTVTFRNNTANAFTGVDVAIVTNANPSQFASVKTSCPAELGPGGDCVVSVTFGPTSTGKKQATLRFSRAGGPNRNVTLKGKAVRSAADVTVDLNDKPDPPHPHTNLVYVMKIRNKGTAPATGVVVESAVPAGVTFEGSATSQGTCSSVPAVGATTGTLRCELGDMPAKDTEVVRMRVKALTPGLVRATATVSSTSPGENTANNSDSATTRIRNKNGVVVFISL